MLDLTMLICDLNVYALYSLYYVKIQWYLNENMQALFLIDLTFQLKLHVVYVFINATYTFAHQTFHKLL